MELLVTETVHKPTQSNYFHFHDHIWERHKMWSWPSRIQIWDPLQLNKSGPFIIIRKVTTMSHERETEYYERCPEGIQPFLICREPVMWSWCNLAASQRRLFCASVNSHSSVGLVSWQWDDTDWACVLRECCRHRHHHLLLSLQLLSLDQPPYPQHTYYPSSISWSTVQHTIQLPFFLQPFSMAIIFHCSVSKLSYSLIKQLPFLPTVFHSTLRFPLSRSRWYTILNYVPDMCHRRTHK